MEQKNNKKIAVFISDLPVYYWQWFNSMINGFAVRGITVDLFAINQIKVPHYHNNVEVISIESKFSCNDKKVYDLVELKSKEKKYDLCIGVELYGLFLASKAADVSNSKLGYYSCELYDEENPIQYQYLIRLFLEMTRAILPSIDIFMIQDKIREKVFFEMISGNQKPKNILHFPVCLPYKEKTELKTEFNLRQQFNLPDNSKILFYIGVLNKRRFINEMVMSAQKFPENSYLIIHGHNTYDPEVIENFNKLNTNNKAILSVENYSDEIVEKMVSDSDAGIVYYTDKVINDYTTGRSSSKLALYLKYKKPVICPDYPTFRADIDKYNYGICLTDWNNLHLEFKKIINNYLHYASGAEKISKAVFDQNYYIDELLKYINVQNSNTKFDLDDIKVNVKDINQSEHILKKEKILTILLRDYLSFNDLGKMMEKLESSEIKVDLQFISNQKKIFSLLSTFKNFDSVLIEENDFDGYIKKSIKVSQGDFIFFLNNCEQVNSELINKFCDESNKYNDVNIFYTDLLFKNVMGKQEGEINYPEFYNNSKTFKSSFKNLNFPFPSGLFINKGLFVTYNSKFTNSKLFFAKFLSDKIIMEKVIAKKIENKKFSTVLIEDPVINNYQEKNEVEEKLDLLKKITEENSLEELYSELNWTNNKKESEIQALFSITQLFFNLNDDDSSLRYFIKLLELTKSENVFLSFSELIVQHNRISLFNKLKNNFFNILSVEGKEKFRILESHLKP